jgi:hypothetical protein
MRPKDDRNPSRLIVEGPDDLFSVVQLTRAHGVDWESEGSVAPYIRQAGGFVGALRELSIALRAKHRRLGIVLDADTSPHDKWMDIRKALTGLADVPLQVPSEGFVGIADNGCHLGIWLMPDNQRIGALEEFLVGLIPQTDSVWNYACEVSSEARQRGARFSASHTQKASVRTWLAWQEQPGVPPGKAIERRYLDAQLPAGRHFIAWFQKVFMPETRE